MRSLYPMLSLIIGFLAIQLPLAFSQVPDHFYNAPENINPDPNYTPGEYVMDDTNVARTMFHMKRSELVESALATDVSTLTTLGMGEIAFTSVKNESATVLGYFRNYFGFARLDNGNAKLEMIVDINSLDTGVPGRNNRILKLFFESMNPKLGYSHIRFDSFSLGAENLETHGDGNVHPIQVPGTITLNGATKEIIANLTLQKQGSLWVVETAEPISILISDFAFGDRAYALIKSCNHKALGNEVTITVRLYFR